MPALTDSLFEFTQATVSLLEDNAATLGLQAVFWGDQAKIPVTPAGCVEPVMKQRELGGVPRRADTNMELYVIIYHARIQDVQITAQECLQLSEAVETLLHQDAQMGGLFIHTLVGSVEPGYAQRTGTLYRATRLSFTAYSKVSLPQSA